MQALDIVVHQCLVNNIYIYFFFVPSWKCCNGISQGLNHSVPTAVTLTNDPGSLELSCRRHGRKCLWPPLLLERRDCERPKPEGCSPSGSQSGPKTAGSLRRENRQSLDWEDPTTEAHDSAHRQWPLQPHGRTKTARDNGASSGRSPAKSLDQLYWNGRSRPQIGVQLPPIL